MTAPTDLYYDPYDVEVDRDPYPVWKRLRDEKPLYYNDKHDFYALSRYSDVADCLIDWESYSSSKGSILELIKSGMQMPPGTFIFEDPPAHDLHRNILRRVFLPRTIAALEPKIREYCAKALDPLAGAGGFDFIKDLGAQMPMRVIGQLLGIPEQDQEAIRDHIDESMRLNEDGSVLRTELEGEGQTSLFEDYINWRATHPSDDLMTELLEAEFEDETGSTRRMSRPEVLGYVNLLAGAGNETTTRLIGWMGKVLADNPDQRQLLVEDPSLIPSAIEEILRYEPPSPVQARYVTKDVEHYGEVMPAGSALLLLNASANRDDRQFENPDRFDVRRKSEGHLSFGYSLHFCLGASLARLEGTVALQEVLKRFPTWEIDTDNAVRAHTSTVRGWERLPVRTS